jgi:hypothetical protein
LRDAIQTNRLKPYRPGFFPQEPGHFFRIMDLNEQALRVVLNVRKVHFEIDLQQYQKVIKYAEPSMPAFELLIGEIEYLVENIRSIEEELKKL